MGPSSQGETFFREIRWPVRWVPAVRWRNNYFARNKKALPLLRPWTQLSASPRTVLFQWKSFVDHIDHAAPRAPRRWMTARPRKRTTRSRGRLCSCFPRGGEYEGLLICLPSPENNSRCESVEGWLGQRWEYVGGGEACAAAQPAAGRREQAVPSALV